MLANAFRSACSRHPRTAALHVLELGAGDGSLMLGVAKDLAEKWTDVRLTLLDRQDLVAPETLTGYSKVGWVANCCVADALVWAEGCAQENLSQAHAPHWDVIVVNLFLHHFEGAALTMLLDAIASRADRFIACEPARSKLALVGSHLIGLTGAGPVTREDAVLSVHAGFSANEISEAWPGTPSMWNVSEKSAGLFSHCFTAQRKELPKAQTP
jgi:predicted nicotinamide N-methyase